MTATLERAAYSVAEVTQMLPVSTRTVYRGVADGSIPAVRVGKRLCIPRSWVEEQFAVDSASIDAGVAS